MTAFTMPPTQPRHFVPYPTTWEINVAFYGTLLWGMLLGNGERIASWHIEPLNQAMYGYILGFTAAFGLQTAKMMLRQEGRAMILCDEGFDRFCSWLCVLFLVAMGALSFCAVHFGHGTHLLTGSAWLAGYVVNSGLIKTLRSISA